MLTPNARVDMVSVSTNLTLAAVRPDVLFVYAILLQISFFVVVSLPVFISTAYQPSSKECSFPELLRRKHNKLKQHKMHEGKKNGGALPVSYCCPRDMRPCYHFPRHCEFYLARHLEDRIIISLVFLVDNIVTMVDKQLTRMGLASTWDMRPKNEHAKKTEVPIPTLKKPIKGDA